MDYKISLWSYISKLYRPRSKVRWHNKCIRQWTKKKEVPSFIFRPCLHSPWWCELYTWSSIDIPCTLAPSTCLIMLKYTSILYMRVPLFLNKCIGVEALHVTVVQDVLVKLCTSVSHFNYPSYKCNIKYIPYFTRVFFLFSPCRTFALATLFISKKKTHCLYMLVFFSESFIMKKKW